MKTEELLIKNQKVKYALEKMKAALEVYANTDSSFKDGAHTIISKINKLVTQIDNKTFTVAVIATMKAGKSTLLNALLGNDYLPTSNTPETASLLYIKHSPECYLQTDNEKISDTENICNAIKERNLSFRENGVDAISKYMLYVPYEKIRSVESVNFQFIDTPGPNEAGLPALKDKVEKVLKMADVILYVMNYSQLNGQADETLFDTVKSMRPDIRSEIKDRFFFVISQIDRQNKNSKTLEETIDYVKARLKKELMEIDNPSIFGVSAERALLARMIQAENFSRIDDLGKIMFGEYGYYDFKSLLEEKRKLFTDEKLAKVIEKSLILELENKIIANIVNNSGSLFYRSIVEKAKNIIKEANNICVTKQGLMYKSREELERVHSALENYIAEIEGDLKEVDRTVKSFYGNVGNEIGAKFNLFEKKISEAIEKLIKQDKNKGNEERKENWVDNFLDSLVNESAENESLKNIVKNIAKTWRCYGKPVFQHVRSFLKNITASEADIQEAKETLSAINNAIENIIQLALSQFKDDLEAEIALECQKNNLKLERIINKANVQFHSKLNEWLAIPSKLEAVPIELPKEDSITIDADYNAFLDKTYRDEGGGLCKSSQRVLDTVSINKDHLVDYWKKAIRIRKEISLKVISQYMSETVVPRIEAVKGTFTEQSDKYLTSVLSELENRKKEQESHAEREEELKKCLAKIEDINKSLE